jgi:hypothetical protein
LGDRAAAVALPGIIRAELLKDDRIAGVTARVTRVVASNGGVELDVTIDVTPADETEDFSLTLSASAAAVTLTGGS